MHMKEKKTWENWIIKEELLWSWTKINRIRLQCINMEHLIHLELLMELTKVSKIKHHGYTVHHLMDPLKLVTYLERVITRILVKIQLILKIQLKTQLHTRKMLEIQFGKTQLILKLKLLIIWVEHTRIPLVCSMLNFEEGNVILY